jgi:hypothetical protein
VRRGCQIFREACREPSLQESRESPLFQGPVEQMCKPDTSPAQLRGDIRVRLLRLGVVKLVGLACGCSGSP